MRPKTIAIAAVTVDGIIARNSHELVRWTSKEDKEFFRTETARIGVMIVGNSTFETFPAPLPNRLHIVMTRTVTRKKPVEGLVEFTDLAPRDILEDLGKRNYKEVVIAGGASVYTLFAKEKLLDELWVTVEPKIFGAGVSLFSEFLDLDLKLESHRFLNKQSLLMKYTINK